MAGTGAPSGSPFRAPDPRLPAPFDDTPQRNG